MIEKILYKKKGLKDLSSSAAFIDTSFINTALNLIQNCGTEGDGIVLGGQDGIPIDSMSYKEKTQLAYYFVGRPQDEDIGFGLTMEEEA